MNADYKPFWNKYIDAITELFAQSRNRRIGDGVDVSELNDLASDTHWTGTLVLREGRIVRASGVHLQSLGELLLDTLPPQAYAGNWRVRIDSNLHLNVLNESQPARQERKGPPPAPADAPRSAISSLLFKRLLSIVRERFPDWEDCKNAGFLEEEINYKHESAAKLQALLSKQEMERLLRAEDYDTLQDRVYTVAHDNNLLFLRYPDTSDIGIIYDPNLDKPGFYKALTSLLHGPGAIDARLRHYLNYVSVHGLPNKWPFPTYFLFLAYPETELFIKPSLIDWWLKETNSDVRYQSTPDVALYRAIKQEAYALWDKLAEHSAEDMIDVQSFMWVCFSVKERND
jgi:hypothetical protein